MTKPKEPNASGLVAKAEIDMPVLFAALEAVMPAASTDPERPQLSAICIEVASPVSRTIATDGHWCAEHKFEVASVEAPGRVIIDVFRAKKLLSMLDGELAGRALLVADESMVRFELERVGRIDCPNIASFPDTDSAWPKGDGQKISRVGMAPKLLAKIGKAFGCKNGTGLAFAFFGTNEPILITSETRQDLRALLMPTRQMEMEL